MFKRISDFLHAIPFLQETVGGLLSHVILEKDGKKQFNPEIVRVAAPRFSRKMQDEAQFSRLLYNPRVQPGDRKALLEDWLPEVGENQKEDFILSCAEKSAGATPAENEERTVDLLIELARIQGPDLPIINKRRTQRAASARFMKPDEGDYILVKLERFAGHRFDDLEELNKWLRDTVAPELNRRAVNAKIRAQARRRWRPIYNWDPRVQRTNMNFVRRLIRTVTGL